MSIDVPLWLFGVAWLAVMLAAGLLLGFGFTGVEDCRRDARRRFGIVLGRDGAALVSSVRRRSMVSTVVAIIAGLAAVVALDADDAALPLMYAGVFVAEVAIARRAVRASPTGPRVAPARPARLRDVVHPLVPVGVAAQLAVVVGLAALLWNVDDRSEVTADRGEMVALITGVAAVCVVALVLAWWVWRRPWRSTHAAALAADAAVRAFAVSGLANVSFFAPILVTAWLGMDVQREVVAFDVGFPVIALAGMAPAFATSFLLQRHARALGARLALPWPPPDVPAAAPAGSTA